MLFQNIFFSEALALRLTAPDWYAAAIIIKDVMDCRPVDPAVAWNVAVATAATRAAQEECAARAHSGTTAVDIFWHDGEGSEERKRKVERRSILVRGLPRNLDENEARAALRALFSEGASTAGSFGAAPSDVRTQTAKMWFPPVAAGQGAVLQSSWRNDWQYAIDGSRKAEPQLAAFPSQRAQLLHQLPYAISSIRVACDQLGGSAYAFVDFSDELLAKLAIDVLGHSAVLPGTSSQVSLFLHETWSSPLVVDQYHLYVAGLPPGATAEYLEAVVTRASGLVPSHVKLASVAGTPTRTGVREYAFLRFANDAAAEAALQKLEEELREICSYFHVVQAAEVHPTRNFSFVRLATHEAALAAITHLHGIQLRGGTLACSWSSRSVASNEEEQRDDEWERAEELTEQRYKPTLTSNDSAKKAAAHAAGEAFWLSLLAENGPITLTDVCRKLTQAQRHAQQVRSRIQQWEAQEWEEDTENLSPQNFTAKPFKP
ncbi:hypothetical protein ACSSS7_004539 [Eimeria intestinalis]